MQDGAHERQEFADVSSGIKISGRSWTMRPVASIIPYARNAKIHSAGQIAKLRSSLREFGFVRPLLIDGSDNLIIGHGVFEAALAEGMSEVPCVVVEGLTEVQRKAYIHADNKLSELSAWDEAMLELDLTELAKAGADLEVLGFDPADLDVDVAAHTRSRPGHGDDETQPGSGSQPESEALDLDEEPFQEKTRHTFHCPKCGFVFEADP